MDKRFKAAAGARFSDEQAERYGQRIARLEEQVGYITPQSVVDDAKHKNSPLHDYFDWDDIVAANSWRIEQAKYLLRHITYTKITDDKEEQIRGFFSITPTKEMQAETPKVYVSLSTILSDREKLDQVINEAYRELKGWVARYKQYSELSAVIQDIERHIKKKCS